MKTWKQRTVIGIFAIISIIFAFIACDNGDDNKPVLCECPEGTTHEPDDQCCEGTDCNCQIAEPAVREFELSFDFQHPTIPEARYNVTIQDARTACGSADLQNVKIDNKDIVTIIEEAIQGAFSKNDTTNPQKTRFRNVFRAGNGGVTIYVDNPETTYKIKGNATVPDTQIA
jgi:hypothetical protein